MEQYTTLVQQTIADAQQIAQTRHHQAIDIAHVWRVLMQSDHYAYQLYQDLQVPMDGLKQVVEQELDKIAVITGSNIQYGQTISQNLNRLLQDANQIATEKGDTYLSIDVLLLALYRQPNQPITQYLVEHGITEAVSYTHLTLPTKA